MGVAVRVYKSLELLALSQLHMYYTEHHASGETLGGVSAAIQLRYTIDRLSF